MEKDLILLGVHIGEHSFNFENLIPELYERCVKPGYNFVTIRTGRKPVESKYFIEWAEYLAKNKVYFVFLYTVQYAPQGRQSQFDRKTIQKIKEVAGKYFVGDMIGETGSSFACKFAGYYNQSEDVGTHVDPAKIRIDFDNMKEATQGYIESVSKYIDIDKKLNMPNIMSVEATGLNKYNAIAGVDMPMLELMCGNPEILISSLRGVARSYNAKRWGTYVAHEWYGGMRHDDTLKRKRLELAYKYAYIAGSQVFCLESGDELVTAYGTRYEQDSDICNDYRNVLKYMANLIKKDNRPKGGPKVKIAFVSGNYDAWGGWGGSSVWNQFARPEWGHSDAEYSWRILDEIGCKRPWTDIANYGKNDLSAFPAYGMYDIVPIEVSTDTLNKYDYLIFLGWNSMTDEIMDKLIQYTQDGGNLLMCAAHLNYNVKRDGEFQMPSSNKIKTLFGAEFCGEISYVNDGVKFVYTSENENLLYPGSKSEACDPIYSAGYVQYAKFIPHTSKITAYVSGSFDKSSPELPAVLEHRIGKGVATIVTSLNYPGNPAVYPLYRAIIREIITSSARECDIKLIGNDRVRYAVYEGKRIYLLNTDYDMPASVTIICDQAKKSYTLEPLELKILDL